MRRQFALGTVLACFAVSGVGISVAALRVATIHCRYDKTLDTLNPGPYENLRIRQAARMVDDYLTRCQAASFIVDGATTARHSTFSLHGARWFIGKIHCTTSVSSGKVPDQVIVHWRCVHRGQYASTVWFDALA